MITLGLVHFAAQLLIVGTVIRTIELVGQGSWYSQALGVIY
jgi:hypothetical protein